MTPYMCAKDITAFLKEKLAESSETFPNVNKEAVPVQVYTGFLPRPTDNEARENFAPSIVLRPTEIHEEERYSLAVIQLSVVTHDKDKRDGCEGLYHLLEWLRMVFLRETAIAGRYPIEGGSMKTEIPDEQPYPFWWGTLTFSVALMRPQEEGINYDDF